MQETTHRMMIIEAVTNVDIKKKDIVKHLKVHPNIVKNLVKHQSIPKKIASFHLEIVSPDIDTIVNSQEMKTRYGLLSNDSLSLQIMEDLKVNNLASNDSDFEKVNFIDLYRPSVSTE